MPAPEDAVIEMDEICVRLTPSLWLWTAVSRKVRQVLGFAFGQRDRATLALCWSDVPADYQHKPVVTDGYQTYTSFSLLSSTAPLTKPRVRLEKPVSWRA